MGENFRPAYFYFSLMRGDNPKSHGAESGLQVGGGDGGGVGQNLNVLLL